MSDRASPRPPVAQTPPQLYCQLVAAGWDAQALARIRDASLRAVVATQPLLRGSGKPFSCHLIGVASLVAEATHDVDLTVAALLHALSQARVAGVDNAASAHPEALANGSADGGRAASRVTSLLLSYAAAGDLQPDAMPVDATDVHARDLRILQLADQLEDGLDGGPWWHGMQTDCEDTRGGAMERVSRLRALAARFAEAPMLGAAPLLERYEAVMAQWTEGRWPAVLRSGWHSSHAPAMDGGA